MRSSVHNRKHYPQYFYVWPTSNQVSNLDERAAVPGSSRLSPIVSFVVQTGTDTWSKTTYFRLANLSARILLHESFVQRYRFFLLFLLRLGFLSRKSSMRVWLGASHIQHASAHLVRHFDSQLQPLTADRLRGGWRSAPVYGECAAKERPSWCFTKPPSSKLHQKLVFIPVFLFPCFPSS